jgi:integrase
MDMPVRLLLPRILQRMFDDLAARVSYGTANYTYRTLRARLNDAVRLKRIARNPLNDVRLRRDSCQPSESKMRRLTTDEAVRFEQAAATDRFGALWILLLHTGLRPSEALGLQWDDVNGDTLEIRRALAWTRETPQSWTPLPKGEKKQRQKWVWHLTEPKTKGSRRTVALTERAAAVLAHHKVEQDAEREAAGELYTSHNLIFASRYGTPLNMNSVFPRHFKAVLRAAGLPSMRVYDLRHSCATIHAAMGTHPRVMASILGHSSTRITLDTYTHADAEMHRDATERFGARLSTTGA